MNIRKALFAQTLSRLMDSRKMTVADLSRALGLPYTTVTDWVHGVGMPRDDKLDLLANYFNVDADALRTGKIRKQGIRLSDIAQHLEGVPQADRYIQLLDAYDRADEKTKKAVNALLEIDW